MRAALITCTSFIWLFMNCQSPDSTRTTASPINPVRLVTLDPGHFHAALVQKTIYEGVDSVVHVYAPAGSDLQLHLNRINDYNHRSDNPTHWKEEVYAGNDFFEKMLAAKAGNVVMLAGNNREKATYIERSLEAGFNVLADKPMVIDSAGFELLKKAFDSAGHKHLLLYDIMTERFEITTILQRELSMLPKVFGELEKGTPENPAVTKESVHYFYKFVSGNVLTRPDWFMDVTQQGEGIADVATHLVDLVQWICFPDQALDYTKDISVLKAKHWTTDLRLSEFKTITQLDSFPSWLKASTIKDSILPVYCNGTMDYTLRGVHARVTARWDYKAPDGSGDTHYSQLRGTKANLIIRQGPDQQYKPTLYIEPAGKDTSYATTLAKQMESITARFPGVGLKKNSAGWEVLVPDKYKEGHEAHFAQVTQNFLNYLKNGNLPAWEVPCMIAKYYTTTKALEMARRTGE